MKTTNTNGRGIFRALASFPVLITAISLFFTVSCEKEETPADDPENFVKISISGVSDGHFTADFQAGKSTETIEYAVCHAVNMKADSAAFMKGSLGNIQQVGLRPIHSLCTRNFRVRAGFPLRERAGLRTDNGNHRGTRKPRKI